MKVINAVIADDEKQIRIYLKTRLQDVWPELNVCAEASNGLEAIELISVLKPDIAFLDIKMPGLSGMEIAKRIDDGCHLVFITAYDQYALEAFENEAVDYLLKPVRTDRLVKTVARLKKRIDGGERNLSHILRAIENIEDKMAVPNEKKRLQWVRVLLRDCIHIISVDTVCAFKSSDKYTAVITEDKEYIIKKPIKELAEELDPENFWQIHRNAIINVKYISNVSRSLTGGYVLKLTKLPLTFTVSRSYINRFKQM